MSKELECICHKQEHRDDPECPRCLADIAGLTAKPGMIPVELCENIGPTDPRNQAAKPSVVERAAHIIERATGHKFQYLNDTLTFNQARLAVIAALEEEGEIEVTEEMLNAGQERMCQLRNITDFDDDVQAEIFIAMHNARLSRQNTGEEGEVHLYYGGKTRCGRWLNPDIQKTVVVADATCRPCLDDYRAP